MKKTKIICTIGPSSSNSSILKKLKKEGVNIFRINMSHTKLSNLPSVLKNLQKNIGKDKICIDTEGAQLRTTLVKKKVFIKKNKVIKILNDNRFSNNKNIYFYPKFDILSISVNTKIFVGFDGIVVKIIDKDLKKNCLKAKVLNSGFLDSNKGIHIDKKVKLDCLTKKDYLAIEFAKKKGVKKFAMSFVNNGEDVITMRKIIGYNNLLISKIETLNAIKNFKQISKLSDAVLIDRGDLSREVPIEKIPLAQENIIKLSKKNKIPVYVATNLLETMINDVSPTRAESHDIYSTLKQGSSGLVLAAESAIGTNPVECVVFLKKCIKAFNSKKI